MKNSITFSTWLTNRYETQAREYRMQLQWILTSCQGYAEGNIWEERHHRVSVELMQAVQVPPLGKYPGEATEEDRKYFAAAHKPDFKNILHDYIKLLPAVCGAG
jgi:hypothetical protein